MNPDFGLILPEIVLACDLVVAADDAAFGLRGIEGLHRVAKRLCRRDPQIGRCECALHTAPRLRHRFSSALRAWPSSTRIPMDA